MDALLQFFTTNVTTGKVWIAFMFLAIYYILKKEPFKIFAHLSEKKEKEHEFAKELLESEKLGKDANEFLREHLERIAFRKYYGIQADPEMRSALLKFYKKHQRSLGWHDLRRAYPNIRLDGSKIAANLNWTDHAFRWLVSGLCYVVGAYALFVIGFATAISSQLSRLEFFGLTVAALVLLMVAVFFSSLNWPYHSTRRVIRLVAEERG